MSALTDKSFIPLTEQQTADKTGEGVIKDEQGERQPKPCKISPRSIFQSLSRYRIAPSRFAIPERSQLKQGASADVQLAIFHPPPPESDFEDDRRYIVALKKFRLDDDSGDKVGLVPIAHELSLLSNLAHRNIVNIVGFVEDAARGIAWIVFPWATNGTLRQFIHSKPCKELPQRASLIKDVVSGLEYLHNRSHPICHGDLKSLNILVSGDFNAAITDFGSARTLDLEKSKPRRPAASQSKKGPSVEFSTSTESITLTGPAWTVRWAAPELFNGDLPSLASDIWALGWICWEALTGDFPFDDVNRENEVVIRIMGGNIPNLTEYFYLPQVNFLCTFIQSCWNMDPDGRPSATESHSSMSSLATSSDAAKIPAEGEHLSSLGISRATGPTYRDEGQLGKGIQDLLKSIAVAQRMGKYYELIDHQKQLDNYRKSDHGIGIVFEEEAIRAWNMGLDLTAAGMYREAEEQLRHAAFSYMQIGLWTQVSECEQFVEGLQEAIRSPQLPTRIPLLLPQTGPHERTGSHQLASYESPREDARLKRQIPKICHVIYSQEYGLKNLTWFIAGALQQASPNSLTENEVFFFIEKYQPWRIADALERGGKADVVSKIKRLLTKSFAFGRSWNNRRWRLKDSGDLPTEGFLPAYDIPLSSSDVGLDPLDLWKKDAQANTLPRSIYIAKTLDRGPSGTNARQEISPYNQSSSGKSTLRPKLIRKIPPTKVHQEHPPPKK